MVVRNKEHTSGAKAPLRLNICGTAEAVPAKQDGFPASSIALGAGAAWVGACLSGGLADDQFGIDLDAVGKFFVG